MQSMTWYSKAIQNVENPNSFLIWNTCTQFHNILAFEMKNLNIIFLSILTIVNVIFLRPPYASPTWIKTAGEILCDRDSSGPSPGSERTTNTLSQRSHRRLSMIASLISVFERVPLQRRLACRLLRNTRWRSDFSARLRCSFVMF